MARMSSEASAFFDSFVLVSLYHAAVYADMFHVLLYDQLLVDAAEQPCDMSHLLQLS